MTAFTVCEKCQKAICHCEGNPNQGKVIVCCCPECMKEAKKAADKLNLKLEHAKIDIGDLAR